MLRGIRACATLGLAVSLIIGSSGGPLAADATAPPTNEELLKELKAMKERIQTLEQQPQQAVPSAPRPATPSAAPPPPRPSPPAPPRAAARARRPPPRAPAPPASAPPPAAIRIEARSRPGSAGAGHQPIVSGSDRSRAERTARRRARHATRDGRQGDLRTHGL